MSVTDHSTTSGHLPALSLDLLKGAKRAAEYIGVSQRSIYHMVEKGYLPVCRRGKTMFFRKSELEAVFQSEAA